MAFCPEVLRHKLQQDFDSYKYNGLRGYQFRVLKRTILKKYLPPGANIALHEAAIKSFIDRNDSLGDKFVVPENYTNLFNDWKNRLYDVFMSGRFQSNKLTLGECFLNGKPGPGASRGTRFTDFYRKMFDGDVTYSTDYLTLHYATHLSPRWKEAENNRLTRHMMRKVSGSSLTSVRKDASKNRCICTEPSLNMYYQLGAKAIINGLLKRHFYLDVSTQPEINKSLARQGSLDGCNATIDLSDASDHIHYDLVKQLLPPQVFRTLDLTRSAYFEVNGEVRKFNMISSMGNGFTFSLMTLLLTSLLDVFLRAHNTKYTPLRDGVFGDDIILPARYATQFCEVLSAFGFKVNHDKSFLTGPFRESCGGDYLHGVNVRGVYIKEVTNEAHIYSTFNRLSYWSVRTGIPLLATLHYVKGLAVFQPIPLHESEDAGFRVPSELVSNRKTDSNGAVYYKASVARSRSFRINEKSSNHHGALITALGGYTRGNRVTCRNTDNVIYKVVKRKTPNWDYSNDPEFDTQDVLLLSLTLRELMAV